DECCNEGELCNQQSMSCELDCGDQEPCGVDDPVCCGAGELCYVGQCIVPGGSCEGLVCATKSTSDCDPDEICDADLGLCVPNLANERCTYTPEAGVFDPVPRF
ncbi:MAG: VCBS repeat-containing protein, partial [Myxococcales bacterium]|nr:VCBS repeat-containing protein [Myxococcales bacterium]